MRDVVRRHLLALGVEEGRVGQGRELLRTRLIGERRARRKHASAAWRRLEGLLFVSRKVVTPDTEEIADTRRHGSVTTGSGDIRDVGSMRSNKRTMNRSRERNELTGRTKRGRSTSSESF
jgi:hypothetical protein